MADDPLQVLLDRTALSNAQKAGLWDLYHAAKNTDDLDSRLKTLDLPKEIKADLWDLKSSEAPPSKPEPLKVEPSAGYWEDRGIAGKVWHPASGVSERNRADNQVFGLPPEMAALGAGTVGRAVLAPGLNAAGRVIAGATAAVGQAAPIIKYEVARHGLKAVGVPEPFATIGGVLAGGYRRGGAANEAAPVADGAVAETEAVGLPKPTEPELTPLELTRKNRAAWQAEHMAPHGPAPQSTVAPTVAAPESVAQEFKALGQKVYEHASKTGKPRLTAGETSLALKLIQRGMTAEDAMKLIDVRKALPQAWKVLPSDEEVEAIVKQANATGRMIR